MLLTYAKYILKYIMTMIDIMCMHCDAFMYLPLTKSVELFRVNRCRPHPSLTCHHIDVCTAAPHLRRGLAIVSEPEDVRLRTHNDIESANLNNVATTITHPRGEVDWQLDHIYDRHVNGKTSGAQAPLRVVVPVVRAIARRGELWAAPIFGEWQRIHGPHWAARVRAVGQESRLNLQPGAENDWVQKWVGGAVNHRNTGVPPPRHAIGCRQNEHAPVAELKKRLAGEREVMVLETFLCEVLVQRAQPVRWNGIEGAVREVVMTCCSTRCQSVISPFHKHKGCWRCR